MRLDKFLVHVGQGSRTQVKQLVKEKRVLVNGTIAKKADAKINEYEDEISVDGIVQNYAQFVYLMLNKPQGVVSATEDNVHRTVIDLIDEPAKGLFPVGRLDIDTEGLLLITNDGQLAHRLLSPKKHVDKTYYVETRDQIKASVAIDFEQGIVIDGDYRCLPAKIEILNENSCYLTIQEGKFHQVKRMFQAVNNQVVFLKRVSMGSLQLDETLKTGQYRSLTLEEMAALQAH